MKTNKINTSYFLIPEFCYPAETSIYLSMYLILEMVSIPLPSLFLLGISLLTDG